MPQRTLASLPISLLSRVCALVALCGGLSDCVPIPQDHNIGRAVTVDPLTIKVGETTKADVIQRLGQPDAIWTDERVFAYIWEHVRLAVLVILVAPAAPGFIGGGDVVTGQELLLIQFDDAGLVQRVDRTRKPSDVGIGEFLKTWVKGPTNAQT